MTFHNRSTIAPGPLREERGIMSEKRFQTGGGFLLGDTDPASVFIPEEFSPEARLIGRTADDFLKKEVLPHIERIENHDLELMHSLMKKAGELGLLGADVPAVYGGPGLPSPTSALLSQKLNQHQSFALPH